jgi:hypothetical protein
MKMKKIHHHLFLCVAILSQLPVLTACKSDDADSPATEPVATETINIDIILPDDVKAVWQPAIIVSIRRETNTRSNDFTMKESFFSISDFIICTTFMFTSSNNTEFLTPCAH